MIDLRFDGVSKRYRIRRDEADTGGGGPLGRAARRLMARPTDFWAVRDVSFEVRRGEALGIIGHNGAGKSTVLKLLSSITSPTRGEITIRGRLSALIEVGSGFHPELTGRENVFLNGSILGMPRREIARKLDSILAFAGVEQFADTPVKRFSSGMYVRLGFSIAAHLDPDVLLLDEVLAVGDAVFQEKCLTRIDELRRAGTTIVFISHDLGAVERLCDRALLLDHGQVAAEGLPRDVIAAYERGAVAGAPAEDARVAAEDGPVRITGAALHTPDGAPTRAVGTGHPLTIRLSYQARETVEDAAVEIFLNTTENELRCHLTTELSPETLSLHPGAGTVEFTCSSLGLQPGLYKVAASIKHRGGPMGGDLHHSHCAMLRVDPGMMVRGDFYTPQSWRRVPAGAAASL